MSESSLTADERFRNAAEIIARGRMAAGKKPWDVRQEVLADFRLAFAKGRDPALWVKQKPIAGPDELCLTAEGIFRVAGAGVGPDGACDLSCPYTEERLSKVVSETLARLGLGE